MENITKIKRIVEALIIISENGISKEDIMNSIPEADMKDVENSIEILNEEYVSQDRSFNVVEIAGRYRISTKPEFMPWISNLYQKEVERLTGPSLETLAILAYKQPATRAEIETVRGVNVGGVLKALLDRDLVRVKGRRDTLGRPLVYETTEKFLELFGLNSIDDLPKLREFEESDLDFQKTNDNIILEINDEDGSGDGNNMDSAENDIPGEDREYSDDVKPDGSGEEDMRSDPAGAEEEKQEHEI